jgi:hypothetical protein
VLVLEILRRCLELVGLLFVDRRWDCVRDEQRRVGWGIGALPRA